MRVNHDLMRDTFDIWGDACHRRLASPSHPLLHAIQFTRPGLTLLNERCLGLRVLARKCVLMHHHFPQCWTLSGGASISMALS